jgi:hemerythrin superfamily protein
MDVTQLLEQDHRAVEALFEEYEQTEDRAVLDRICSELEVHTIVEEELVYPRLEAVDRELEEHAEQEHGQAKELIAQIRSGDPDATMLARQLKSAVQHHVQEEETKAFPRLREQIPGELAMLGRAVEDRKQELQSPR